MASVWQVAGSLSSSRLKGENEEIHGAWTHLEENTCALLDQTD
jgi:hypothetical protein